MLIFLWQQPSAIVPPPVYDIGLAEEPELPVVHHQGHGDTTLESVVGYGTGRIRRAAIAHPLSISSSGFGSGHRRTRGAGITRLGDMLCAGGGRRRTSGRGSLALVLMRTTDRDALVALAANS